ncbi:uncharacterized protein TNCV_711941 [Trichonephila clavipes]|nr:uncharacterized protein TNCV_711941 [Trichonephila clavipes]
MLDVTKYPPSAHGFTCRNCGGGDRGRVAIYRPFGEVSLSLNRTVTCMVLKANDRRTSCPCHDEFRGPRSDYVRQTQMLSQISNFDREVNSCKASQLCNISGNRLVTKSIARGRRGHHRGMKINRDGRRTYRNCDTCLNTELTLAHILDCPAIPAAL